MQNPEKDPFLRALNPGWTLRTLKVSSGRCIPTMYVRVDDLTLRRRGFH
jgi:hypothetical protein